MKKSYLIFLALGLSLSLSACGKTKVVKTTESYEIAEEAGYSGKDYITVAESENMELLLKPSTGNLRWQDKETGEYLDTTKAETDMDNKTAKAILLQ